MSQSWAGCGPPPHTSSCYDSTILCQCWGAGAHKREPGPRSTKLRLVEEPKPQRADRRHCSWNTGYGSRGIPPAQPTLRISS